MSFRITAISDSTQKITALPISATTGAAIKCDSGAATQDVSFACWFYCEHDGRLGQFTIWETYTSPSTAHFGLYLDCDGAGTYKLRVNFKGASNVIGAGGYTLPTSPLGKWLLIVFTHHARPASGTDYHYLTVHDPGAGTTIMGGSGVTLTAGSVPDFASIGNNITLSAGNRNAIGITIPSVIVGTFFMDGTTQDSLTTTSIAVLATNRGLTGHIEYGTELQQIAISGTPTGGTFTITFEGQTTGAIAFNAAAAAVQTALEALSNIAPGDVVCTGGALPGAAVVVEFKGVLAGANRTLMTSSSSLTGGSSPTITITRTRSAFAFTGCVWAANYAAGAYSSANEDARGGKTLLAGGDASGNLCVFDVGSGVFPNYHQQPRGSTITGTMTSVNPYTYGAVSYPPPRDVTVGSESLPATSLTLAASGRRGPAASALATWIASGTGSGQLRVGFFANSRAVYSAQYALRLSDGTFPGRTMACNFSDMGIIGQAGLWNNGRIIGGLFPVPTCQWSGVNALEGAYGPDCSAALPRCTNSVPSVVNPSVVLTSLVDSTLGSRFSLASRTATSVPVNGADANNYRGPGCGIRLSPSCTYRIMIRPEAGLPVTDALDVKLHFTNYPASSTVSARKVVGASQSATEDSSSVLASPGLGAASANVPPTAKSITAVSAASLSSQVAHTSYGSVTVNDVDNGFSTLAAGDMMQLSSSAGTSNVYNEAWIVRTVTGKGTATCVITYEWLPRQAPVIGDKVTYVKATEILATATASFTAGEVAAGKWRGIEVTAGAGGDGVILWGLEFVNPTRAGVFVVPIGRSGCGAWIQAARWPRVEDGGGVSLNERILSLYDLDVFVATTADQGTAGGHYVESYDWLIDYVQADSPTTEIVVYATGPEWTGENTLDKSDVGDKYDYTAAMQYAAVAAGVPMTAFLFGRYTSAFTRLTTGDDTTESPTHPSCVLDVTFLGTQLAGLPSTFVPAGAQLACGPISIGL